MSAMASNEYKQRTSKLFQVVSKSRPPKPNNKGNKLFKHNTRGEFNQKEPKGIS